MMEKRAKRKANFEKAVHSYVKAFTKKHEIEFEYWIGDVAGTVGEFGDYYFNFEDVRHDIDTDQPKDNIFLWYDECLESKEITPNYENWCKLKK